MRRRPLKTRARGASLGYGLGYGGGYDNGNGGGDGVDGCRLGDGYGSGHYASDLGDGNGNGRYDSGCGDDDGESRPGAPVLTRRIRDKEQSIMKVLAAEHFLAAIAYIKKHPEEYNQSAWCGTACCVLGHARRIAGSGRLKGGVREGEIADCPKAQRIAKLTVYTSPDVLKVMEGVGMDGGIDLSSTDTSNANLRRVNLAGVNLADADLSDADLTGADLRWANFTGANLTNADLRYADLRGANLSNADLTGADLTGADLTGAIR